MADADERGHEPAELDTLRPYASVERYLGVDERFELTRFVLLRLLGFVYTAAFGSLLWQVLPLIGAAGLTPAARYVASAITFAGSRGRAFVSEPSLFFFVPPSDGVLIAASALGLALSLLVLLGVSNAAVMFALWALYRSFTVIGQHWYGYGWEILLVETGFLAMFACPLRGAAAFPRTRVPLVVVWLFRWLGCRVMLGAGLIKIRSDSCWRELTCLDFHFETQPLPNPLSPIFHALPHWVHAGGVLFNHVAELLFPLCMFAPRRVRTFAGIGMIVFQAVLIASGNLSFLNWLSIVPLLAYCNDDTFARVLPRAWRVRAAHADDAAPPHTRLALAYGVLVAALSIAPVTNMLSRQQRMNAAFEPLMLVNSYGAFGSVGRTRAELVIEGTRSQRADADARWEPYEFPAKPGDLARALPIVSPLQPRLDWQIWFAAMSSAEQEPWMLVLVWKLLHADPGVRRLLARDPFGDVPPRYVRVLRYRYRFAPPGSDVTWLREPDGRFLPPLAAEAPLRTALEQLGHLQ